MNAIYTDLVKSARVEVKGGQRRLKFIPWLFSTALGDTLVSGFLNQHSDYIGGYWDFYYIPEGISGQVAPHSTITTTCATGYITPPEGNYKLSIPGNYFEGEVTADAAGIISTLFILNQLTWKTHELGEGYQNVCRTLSDRNDALKDYISIVQHPEADKIYAAID